MNPQSSPSSNTFVQLETRVPRLTTPAPDWRLRVIGADRMYQIAALTAGVILLVTIF